MEKLSMNVLYEFVRGEDPMKSLNIGTRTKILNDLADIYIKPENVNIEGNLIEPINNIYSSSMEDLFNIQQKYLSQVENDFLNKIVEFDRYKKVSMSTAEEAIDNALTNGISVERLKKLIKIWGNDLSKKIIPYLSKKTRTKEEEEYDNENNIYVFIGYMDKEPVTINGKRYFEEKLQCENMIKIDKYNLGDLSSINMMKIRAQHQYGGTGAVYMIHIPKDIMDEEQYDKIPEEYRDLIEKLMKKI